MTTMSTMTTTNTGTRDDDSSSKKRSIMSPMKNPKRLFFGFKMKFSKWIDYTRKISEFPPCGKGEKEGESFPIAYINPNFWLSSFPGFVAEVVERLAHNQEDPGTNPVGNQYFFLFLTHKEL